eukprot:TRINITY_DN60291_c0_g1_i1.p1 TRINITY_DN60291_c0_g1~~TRINITY_DN60291_c0_g1_i1.p1  ORF type:complete len:743 (+),score=179.05 TRINITY_DN60291_c0_g1_i1:74-2302(+)
MDGDGEQRSQSTRRLEWDRFVAALASGIPDAAYHEAIAQRDGHLITPPSGQKAAEFAAASRDSADPAEQTAWSALNALCVDLRRNGSPLLAIQYWHTYQLSDEADVLGMIRDMWARKSADNLLTLRCDGRLRSAIDIDQAGFDDAGLLELAVAQRVPLAAKPRASWTLKTAGSLAEAGDASELLGRLCAMCAEEAAAGADARLACELQLRFPHIAQGLEPRLQARALIARLSEGHPETALQLVHRLDQARKEATGAGDGQLHVFGIDTVAMVEAACRAVGPPPSELKGQLGRIATPDTLVAVAGWAGRLGVGIRSPALLSSLRQWEQWEHLAKLARGDPEAEVRMIQEVLRWGEGDPGFAARARSIAGYFAYYFAPAETLQHPHFMKRKSIPPAIAQASGLQGEHAPLTLQQLNCASIYVTDLRTLQLGMRHWPTDADLVGFDQEADPYGLRQVSLLQISTARCCLLIDLLVIARDPDAVTELDGFLRPLMADPGVLKLGVGITEDFAMLRRQCAWPCFMQPILGVVNVRKVFNDINHWHAPGMQVGLASLTAYCLGRVLSKDQQVSAWGRRPLNAMQLEYAALDAAVQPAICQVLVEQLVSVAGLPQEAPRGTRVSRGDAHELVARAGPGAGVAAILRHYAETIPGADRRPGGAQRSQGGRAAPAGGPAAGAARQAGSDGRAAGGGRWGGGRQGQGGGKGRRRRGTGGSGKGGAAAAPGGYGGKRSQREAHGGSGDDGPLY